MHSRDRLHASSTNINVDKNDRNTHPASEGRHGVLHVIGYHVRLHVFQPVTDTEELSVGLICTKLIENQATMLVTGTR